MPGEPDEHRPGGTIVVLGLVQQGADRGLDRLELFGSRRHPVSGSVLQHGFLYFFFFFFLVRKLFRDVVCWEEENK